MSYEYLEYDAMVIRVLDNSVVMQIPELAGHKEVLLPKSQLDEVDAAIIEDKGEYGYEISVRISTWILKKKGLI